MGFQPDYIIKPYITSRMEVSRMQYGSLTSVAVKPEFDITTVETEQRSHTVLNSLGIIGGAWSLAILAYKILFGDDAIQPFGLLQNRGYFYKRTQKKLTKSLSTYPLVNLLDSSNNIDDEDDESRVGHLDSSNNIDDEDDESRVDHLDSSNNIDDEDDESRVDHLEKKI
ncbi:hypothetical protein C2G38_2068545, partial [Gigaspora rosea]